LTVVFVAVFSYRTKGLPSTSATLLANVVFPMPGGPTNSMIGAFVLVPLSRSTARYSPILQKYVAQDITNVIRLWLARIPSLLQRL
jgi:hypothetical protein